MADPIAPVDLASIREFETETDTPLIVGAQRSFENPETSLSDPDNWLMETLGGGTSTVGININRVSAMTYDAVWRCVNMISRDVAKLPLILYEDKGDKGGGRHRADAHPAYGLVKRRPNERTGPFYFWQTLMGHVLLRGNGYALIRRLGSGAPSELLVLDPDSTFPVLETITDKLFYITTIADREHKFEAANILHLRGLGWDGLVGYSVVEFAANSFGLGLGAQMYASKFFKNNARPNIVLEYPHALQAKVVKQTLKDWENLYGGLDKAHRTALLQRGVTAKAFGANAKESQLLELRGHERISVANWFGVPPHKVGDPSRTSYNSLEEEERSYLDQALEGWFIMIEQECEAKLLTKSQRDRGSHFFEYKREALLRADTKTVSENLVLQLNNGVITQDEARAILNLQKAPKDGEKFRIPANIGFIGEEPPEIVPEPGQPVPKETPKDGKKEEKSADPTAGVLDSLQAALRAQVDRMVNRIGLQAIRAAKHPDSYIDWIEGSLDGKNRSVVRDAFTPIIASISELLGTDREDRLNEVVDSFMEDAYETLLKAAECLPASLETTVGRWAGIQREPMADYACTLSIRTMP